MRNSSVHRSGVRIQAEQTLELAESMEGGHLSVREYCRRRAQVVGEGNVIDFVVLPILRSLLRDVAQRLRLRRLSES
jgi:hypothetical protein